MTVIKLTIEDVVQLLSKGELELAGKDKIIIKNQWRINMDIVRTPQGNHIEVWDDKGNFCLLIAREHYDEIKVDATKLGWEKETR